MNIDSTSLNHSSTCIPSSTSAISTLSTIPVSSSTTTKHIDTSSTPTLSLPMSLPTDSELNPIGICNTLEISITEQIALQRAKREQKELERQQRKKEKKQKKSLLPSADMLLSGLTDTSLGRNIQKESESTAYEDDNKSFHAVPPPAVLSNGGMSEEELFRVRPNKDGISSVTQAFANKRKIDDSNTDNNQQSTEQSTNKRPALSLPSATLKPSFLPPQLSRKPNISTEDISGWNVTRK